MPRADRLELARNWLQTYDARAKSDLLTTMRLAVFQKCYATDVEAFVHDCFHWDRLPEAERGPTDYQLDVLTQLYEHKRLAVRGPHGIGKTAIASWFLLHFALSHDGAADWKVPTTASAWRQLREYLWPEIHKWARLINWDKIGRPPFHEPFELQDMALRLGTGNAFALACTEPATIEGAHGDALAYLYDEAKTIPAEMWEATEGAFAGAGRDTARVAYALALSTPGAPSGTFYAIHRRDPRYADWHAAHVTLDEAVAQGRLSSEWASSKRTQWGASSAVYLNRVEGEFAAADEQSVIPLGWVEAAIDRWREQQVQSTDGSWAHPAEFFDAVTFTCASCDVADTGEDATVIALRYADTITQLRIVPFSPDPMQTAGHVAAALLPRNGYAVVDGIGVGSGVVARLRELDISVDSFIASNRSERVDNTGEFGFANRRAEAWWLMRELLDPSQPSGATIALPADDDLLGDLTAPKWKLTSAGKVLIESKEDIRARIGRSTDKGDAVVMAFNARLPGPQIVSSPAGYRY